MPDFTKVYHAALDDKGGEGDVVLRGVIDQGYLGIHPDSPAVIQKFFQIKSGMHGSFMVGDYQREVLSGQKHTDLVKAFMSGQRVPDIEVGVRGKSCKKLSDGVFELHDDLYIIDGLQRMAAAREALQLSNDTLKIHLGATFYFSSTVEWERLRFRTLNLARTKLSPNVHLRNLRQSNRAIATLYDLTTRQSDLSFSGRIQWGQNANRQEFLTALGLTVVMTMLHWRHGHGAKNTQAEDQARSLAETLDDIGVRALQGNLKQFFEVIDEVWGIRTIAFKEKAVYTRQNFLLVLAEIFTRHGAFWDGKSLKVDKLTRDKLQKFPLRDPAIMDIIQSGGAGGQRVLYGHLLDHINSGRRSSRLIADFSPKSEVLQDQEEG